MLIKNLRGYRDASADHANYLICGSDAGEDRKDSVHKLVQVVFETGTSVTDNHKIKVEVTSAVGRAGNTYVRGASTQNDGVDSTRAKTQFKMSLMEGVPAVFVDGVIAGSGFDLVDDFSSPIRTRYCAVGCRETLVRVRPGRQRVIGVGIPMGGVEPIGPVVGLRKKRPEYRRLKQPHAPLRS